MKLNERSSSFVRVQIFWDASLLSANDNNDFDPNNEKPVAKITVDQ